MAWPCSHTESARRLNTANDDQKVGVNIVRRALQAPARQIAENAGEDGAVIVGKILDKEDYAFGFNAATGEYGNLVKQGVIDPAKVVRTALQDAASVAGLLDHHRGDGGREAEEEGARHASWRRRHGRHGFLSIIWKSGNWFSHAMMLKLGFVA